MYFIGYVYMVYNWIINDNTMKYYDYGWNVLILIMIMWLCDYDNLCINEIWFLILLFASWTHKKLYKYGINETLWTLYLN